MSIMQAASPRRIWNQPRIERLSAKSARMPNRGNVGEGNSGKLGKS
ncbi:hypothetical protein [Sphingomicrobium sediminis]|uniref:Uncharacterized protein n=1 Tax=Sphingomicrobium sediminis TaxID=2950949 RepID=A0A9X2EHV2_9SPHN|nr:hypothetical protein [Sphingomicrobium sediminis]MCM8558315.1 hypothetical protein [Sphingomicrobium sediminis]